MNKGETITKEYFDEHTKQFATKKDLELMMESSRKETRLMMSTYKKDMDISMESSRQEMRLMMVDSKKDMEIFMLDSKQHANDLKTFFTDSLMGIGEYVKSVDEKVDRLDDKVTNIDLQLSRVKDDISIIRDVLEEKASRKEVFDLNKRVVNLEARFV